MRYTLSLTEWMDLEIRNLELEMDQDLNSKFGIT
jgi:hypothetical protein